MKKLNFTSLLEWAKPTLISFLRKKAIKLALKKILGNALAGGLKAWLVRYIVEEMYDEVAKPIIQGAFEHIGYVHEVQKGKHVLRRIEDAEDVDEWRDTIRNS